MNVSYARADSVVDAQQAKGELSALLRSAQMELSKWASNSPELLSTDDSGDSVPKEIDQVVSTLGMSWLPKMDLFCFKVALSPNLPKYTKRSILSETARLFDPMGWIALIMITAKILLQNLWIAEMDWDTELPQDLQRRWFDFRRSLTSLEIIKIPR